MDTALWLGVLNTIQVLFLGYLTYRQEVMRRTYDKDNGNGRPKRKLQS